jgi:aspartate aminotransferase/aminotransferase
MNVADYISHRARAIDASGIRKVFDLAAQLKDPINLSIGLPDFDVPDAVKDAAIDAIRRGDNRYTQTQGIGPLRNKAREHLKRDLGRDPGEVVITGGVSGGILLALLATVNPGDEVIFLDPYFVMYKHLITMIGGQPVIVDSYPDFRFRADRVAKLITPKSKILILNSPSNPTGVVMTEAEVNAAVELARKHNLLILSDEIYEPFLYDKAAGSRVGGQENGGLPTPARTHDRTVILRGFSKSHAMTGWRVGYAAGPEPIITEMIKLQQYTFVCAPAPFQYAAMRAMDLPMRDAVAAYRRKRDIVFERLGRKFEIVKPQGAFYCFPAAPRGTSASDFCAKAIERNVLTIPGGVFSERDTHFRVSYATTDERLAQGCDVLCSLV